MPIMIENKLLITFARPSHLIVVFLRMFSIIPAL